MSENLKSYLPILQEIAKHKSSDRKILIEIFLKDKNFREAVREIAVNTVNCNLKFTEKQRHQLRPHKRATVKVASDNYSKQDIVQAGSGILPILVPIVASIISSLTNG